MQKLFLLPAILLLFTAGCTTAAPPVADEPDILLIRPSDPFPTVSGQGMYVKINTAETAVLPASYNLGYVTIPSRKCHTSPSAPRHL